MSALSPIRSSVYTLAPPRDLEPNVRHVQIPSDMLGIILLKIAASYPRIRLTCRTWNSWFESKVNQYTPSTDNRYERVLQTVRILRISSHYFNELFIQYSNIKECLFDRKEGADSKLRFYYYAASLTGDQCNFLSNRAKFPSLNQVHDITGSGPFESRLWFVRHTTHSGIHRFCGDVKVVTSLLDVDPALEACEHEVIQSEHFVATIVNRVLLQFRNLPKSEQFEVTYTANTIQKAIIHDDQVIVILSDGSVEKLGFSKKSLDPKDDLDIKRKRKFLRKKTKAQQPNKVRVVLHKNENTPNRPSKHKFYSISVHSSACMATTDYTRELMIPSDPAVKITAIKVCNGKLFVGKSNGSISAIWENNTLNFDSVHEGAVEDLATDGTILFSTSNFPSTVIKCHVLASPRLELISQFSSRVPVRIFYGEGIFIKGSDRWGWHIYDYNFQNPMGLIHHLSATADGSTDSG